MIGLILVALQIRRPSSSANASHLHAHPEGGVTTPPRGITTFSPPPSVAARPAWLPAIYKLTPEVSAPSPDARPSWLPAIYELNPEIPTPLPMRSAESMQVLRHPQADDPLSRNFVRNHPRRSPVVTPAARCSAVYVFACQSVLHALAHDYSISPGFAFDAMSAPIDDPFSNFRKDDK